MNRTPVLDIRHLSKTYPGQRALTDAQLLVHSGEVHALIGQNGSGKSTLIKVVAGYIKADHGAKVLFNGEPIDLWHQGSFERSHIRIVHQDLGLVPTLSAIENLALGRGFDTDQSGRIRWRREAKRCQELLLAFGLAPDVRSPVSTLTAAERAAIAIMRALQDWDDTVPGLLILDEPTTSLNSDEVNSLFHAIRRLAEQGAAVIFVSHVLSEVLELADKVTVLRDGAVVASGESVSRHNQNSLIELMIGSGIVKQQSAAGREKGRHALEVEHVSGAILRDVSFKVRTGEVVGIAGLVGSGREEIGTCVFGATPHYSGKVLVNKEKLFAHPHNAVKLGVALVPADRKRLGLIPAQRLEDHIPLPQLATLRDGLRIRLKRLRTDAENWARRLDVEPLLLHRRLEKFSGGNQQKAVLARWLRTNPQVLVLDDPTQGVDIGAKSAIYESIDGFARQGGAVLVTSPDADELVRLCDRVLIMRGGMIGCELSGSSLTTGRVVRESLGATSLRAGSRIVERRIAFSVTGARLSPQDTKDEN